MNVSIERQQIEKLVKKEGSPIKPKENDRLSSVQNALRLLNVFTVDEPELGISDISEKLNIAKSTVHRLVTTLASEGFIVKSRNSSLYRLGISILALSNVVTSMMYIHQAALPILHEMVKKANESVTIAIFRGDEVIFLNRVDSARSIRSLSMTGSRVPPHCTSSGQVFLANQSKETVARILDKGLQALTNKTITDPKQLCEKLKKVKERGYAVSMEELHEGVVSVAAPIRNDQGQVIATVSIVAPVQRMTNNVIPCMINIVVQGANEISQRYRRFDRS